MNPARFVNGLTQSGGNIIPHFGGRAVEIAGEGHTCADGGGAGARQSSADPALLPALLSQHGRIGHDGTTKGAWNDRLYPYNGVGLIATALYKGIV